MLDVLSKIFMQLLDELAICIVSEKGLYILPHLPFNICYNSIKPFVFFLKKYNVTESRRWLIGIIRDFDIFFEICSEHLMESILNKRHLLVCVLKDTFEGGLGEITEGFCWVKGDRWVRDIIRVNKAVLPLLSMGIRFMLTVALVRIRHATCLEVMKWGLNIFFENVFKRPTLLSMKFSPWLKGSVLLEWVYRKALELVSISTTLSLDSLKEEPEPASSSFIT